MTTRLARTAAISLTVLCATPPSLAQDAPAVLADAALTEAVSELAEHWLEARARNTALYEMYDDVLAKPESPMAREQVKLLIEDRWEMYEEALRPGNVLVQSGTLLKLIPQVSRPDAISALSAQCQALYFDGKSHRMRERRWSLESTRVDDEARNAALASLAPGPRSYLGSAYASAVRFSATATRFCSYFGASASR